MLGLIGEILIRFAFGDLSALPEARGRFSGFNGSSSSSVSESLSVSDFTKLISSLSRNMENGLMGGGILFRRLMQVEPEADVVDSSSSSEAGESRYSSFSSANKCSRRSASLIINSDSSFNIVSWITTFFVFVLSLLSETMSLLVLRDFWHFSIVSQKYMNDSSETLQILQTFWGSSGFLSI